MIKLKKKLFSLQTFFFQVKKNENSKKEPKKKCPHTPFNKIGGCHLSWRFRRIYSLFRSERPSTPPNRNLRLKSPSIPKERTRDELIDSIVHTRTREHRYYWVKLCDLVAFLVLILRIIMKEEIYVFTYRVSHETWQLENSIECLLPYTI